METEIVTHTYHGIKIAPGAFQDIVQNLNGSSDGAVFVFQSSTAGWHVAMIKLENGCVREGMDNDHGTNAPWGLTAPLGNGNQALYES